MDFSVGLKWKKPVLNSGAGKVRLPSFPEEFETRKGEERRIAWKLEGTIEIIWALIQSEKTEAQRRELISSRLHSKVITGLGLEGWLPDCIQCYFNL